MVTINPCDFSNPVPCGVNPAYSYTRYPCDQDDPRPNDTRGLPVIVDLKTPVKAEVINRHRESILAIEGELGIEPSGTYTTVRARLDAMESLLCGIWEALGVGITVLYNDLTVTYNTPVKQINFFGAGVTVSEDQNFATNGRVNVNIPCCGSGGLPCIDGYQPVQETLYIITNGQTAFTLSFIPSNNIVLLFIGGLKQDAASYTVNGTSITWLGTTLTTSDTVEVFYDVFHGSSFGNVYEPVVQNLPVVTAGQTIFNLAVPPKNNFVSLFIGGLKQQISSYSVIGTMLIWNGNPSLITTDTVQAFYTVNGTSGDIWPPIVETLPVTSTGQLVFTLSQPAWSNLVLLFIGGIKQTDYIVTGTTVTWTGSSTLIPSDVVEVMYFNHITGQCQSSTISGSIVIAEDNNIVVSEATVIDFSGNNVSVTNNGNGIASVVIEPTFPELFKFQDNSTPDGYYRTFEYTAENCVALQRGIATDLFGEISESSWGGNGLAYSASYPDISVFIELELVTNCINTNTAERSVYRSVYQANIIKSYDFGQQWNSVQFTENINLLVGPAYDGYIVPVTGNIGNSLLPPGSDWEGSVEMSISNSGSISILVKYPLAPTVSWTGNVVTTAKLRVFGGGRYQP